MIVREAFLELSGLPHRLAWLWATCPRENVRDGKRAVGFARQACELACWKERRYVETPAAACAEAGDFKGAAQWQKEALGRGYEDKEDEARACRRLVLYQQRKPCREE